MKEEITKAQIMAELRKNSPYQHALNDIIKNSKGFPFKHDSLRLIQDLIDQYLSQFIEENKKRRNDDE